MQGGVAVPAHNNADPLHLSGQRTILFNPGVSDADNYLCSVVLEGLDGGDRCFDGVSNIDRIGLKSYPLGSFPQQAKKPRRSPFSSSRIKVF